MRRVPISLVIAALLVHGALLVIINLAFGAELPGLNTFTANVVFCLVVGGLVFGRSHLRWHDVGLQRQHLAAGVGFTVLVLVGSSAALMLASALLPEVSLVFDWTRLEPSRLGAALINHFLIIAPYEEAFFRGFVFVQLYLLFHKWLPRLAMLSALLGSQVLFSLGHIPNTLWVTGGDGDLVLNLTRLLFNGLLYTFIYLLTGNLFMVIGVHALHNVPPLVLVSRDGTLWTLTSSVILLSGLLLAFGYWRLQATSLLARLHYTTGYIEGEPKPQKRQPPTSPSSSLSSK